MPMTEAEWGKVRTNLFPLAVSAVQPWDTFRWHRDRNQVCQTFKPNSSQALAIDVFGFLKAARTEVRANVLGGIAEGLGLPSQGPWDIELEWIDNQNRLQENQRSPTQVDCVARGAKALIFFECKFAERSLGFCSQTQALRHGSHQGVVQCNGHYERQENPVNGQTARCCLDAKGIRYWKVVPEVFQIGARVDYRPCPFCGSLYQLMRNAVLCYEVAKAETLRPGFAVIYAEGAGLLPSQEIPKLASQSFRPILRTDRIAFATWTYQKLLGDALRRLNPSYSSLLCKRMKNIA